MGNTIVGEYDSSLPETETLYYDEIKAQSQQSTLIIVADQQHWLTNKFISIDTERKEIYMPKWYYDKFFI